MLLLSLSHTLFNSTPPEARHRKVQTANASPKMSQNGQVDGQEIDGLALRQRLFTSSTKKRVSELHTLSSKLEQNGQTFLVGDATRGHAADTTLQRYLRVYMPRYWSP